MLNESVALVCALLLTLQAAPAGDRIYGRVLTVAGERLEGFLRWDRNEASWTDALDGEKAIPAEYDREAERLDPELRRRRELERRIDLPGLRITWDEDDGEPRTSAASVRFGHIDAIEVLDDRRARIVLASGSELELRRTTSDIGSLFRGLVVEDRARGEVELRWRELDRVELMAAPPGAAPPQAIRLFGTVRTTGGAELTGYLAWDMDETLSTDVLDGRQGRSRHQIPFARIAALAREGRDATRVTLLDGDVLVLRGTNDVDEDNRGIEISDPELGRAVVPWRELESVVFASPPNPGVGGSRAARAFFDGGRPLSGTVETRAGGRLTGRIRWDNDEEFSWEALDGSEGGVDYDVELGQVRSIERVEPGATRVELLDGRVLHLEGSSDVDDGNQGLFVRGAGSETALVPWRDFRRVTFTR